MTGAADGHSGAALTSPSRVVALLRRHGLTPDKGFGQNFLIDASVLGSIVTAADIRPEHTVFEVGPGLGALTVELAARARRVVTVELDRRLLPVLAETLADCGNVEVIQADAARFDFGRLPRGTLLVANLPYNVATAVVTHALESGRFDRMVFLVQREVAERMTAQPSTAAFGALTLLVQHFGQARTLRRVPPGVFLPPPKVTSSVVRIDVRPDAASDPALFGLIHEGFAHRRKTLLKNLTMAGFERTQAERALTEAGCEPRVRAEQLDLEAFRRLLRALGRTNDGR